MWVFFAALAGALVATYVFAPKPQSQPSPMIDDLTVPTAESGKDIGVLFGCRERKDPNVLWYGNFRTVAIKTKGGKK